MDKKSKRVGESQNSIHILISMIPMNSIGRKSMAARIDWYSFELNGIYGIVIIGSIRHITESLKW